MTQPAIQFYHLLTTPLERALPKLMEKACASGMRTVIWGQAEQIKRLDVALWTYDPDSFLPHGTAADPMPERQPVYLTEKEENPNGATLLVVTDGRTPSYILPLKGEESERSQQEGAMPTFERIFDMFDGSSEEATDAARARWKAYKEQGYALTYIKQRDDGGWEVKMKTETQ